MCLYLFLIKKKNLTFLVISHEKSFIIIKISHSHVWLEIFFLIIFWAIRYFFYIFTLIFIVHFKIKCTEIPIRTCIKFYYSLNPIFRFVVSVVSISDNNIMFSICVWDWLWVHVKGKLLWSIQIFFPVITLAGVPCTYMEWMEEEMLRKRKDRSPISHI